MVYSPPSMPLFGFRVESGVLAFFYLVFEHLCPPSLAPQKNDYLLEPLDQGGSLRDRGSAATSFGVPPRFWFFFIGMAFCPRGWNASLASSYSRRPGDRPQTCKWREVSSRDFESVAIGLGKNIVGSIRKTYLFLSVVLFCGRAGQEHRWVARGYGGTGGNSLPLLFTCAQKG